MIKRLEKENLILSFLDTKQSKLVLNEVSGNMK